MGGHKVDQKISIEKYDGSSIKTDNKYKIPLRTYQDFIKFDKRLIRDQDFSKNVVSCKN